MRLEIFARRIAPVSRRWLPSGRCRRTRMAASPRCDPSHEIIDEELVELAIEFGERSEQHIGQEVTV